MSRFRRSLRMFGAALAVYVRATPGAAAVRTLAGLVAGAGPVVVALLTRALLDRLVADAGPALWVYAVAIVGVGALMAVGQHVSTYADREIGRRVTAYTQSRMFAAVSARPGLADLEDPAFQDRLRMAQQAGQVGPQQLAGAVLSIAQSLVTMVGFVVTLIATSPMVAALVLASAVPTLWAQLALGRQRVDMTMRMTPRTRRQMFYALLLMDVRAAKEIRLYGLGDFFRLRLLDELSQAQAGERRVDRSTLRTDGSLTLLSAVVTAFAMVVAVNRIGAGAGSVGDLSVLVVALAGVQSGVAGIVGQISTAGQMLTLFGEYVAITADAPQAVHAAGAPATTLGPLRHAIELRDVWFRYHPDHDWILRGVTLTIPYGQSVALVGVNGAGKSTLVKLICRLYEPTRGAITWDGTDIRDIDPTVLRDRIGAVFQDYMTYELSAADNVAVGDLSAAGDMPRLREAAEVAGIDGTLVSLPDGYDTMLSRAFSGPAAMASTRSTPAASGSAAPTVGAVSAVGPVPGAAAAVGVVLSGGQWQRVAIARAVLRSGADLLILDEPSSGLDAQAEHGVHQSLRTLRGERSCLLISHRLNTVRNADNIAVLDGGRITELGTHEALMELDGAYARLFRLQADGYQLLASNP